MRKSKNNWLWDLNTIQLYQLILIGKVEHFPSGYWDDCLAEKRAIQCIRYLFENILKLPEEKYLKINYSYYIKKYKLSGMLKKVFNGNGRLAIEAAYPHLKDTVE